MPAQGPKVTLLVADISRSATHRTWFGRSGQRWKLSCASRSQQPATSAGMLAAAGVRVSRSPRVRASGASMAHAAMTCNDLQGRRGRPAAGRRSARRDAIRAVGMAIGRRGGSVIRGPKLTNDRPDRSDQPGSAVAQLEQTLVRGGGDFPRHSQSPAGREACSTACCRRRCRGPASISSGVRSGGTRCRSQPGTAPAAISRRKRLSQRALAHDMKRPGWPRTEHHTRPSGSGSAPADADNL